MIKYETLRELRVHHSARLAELLNTYFIEHQGKHGISVEGGKALIAGLPIEQLEIDKQMVIAKHINDED